MMISGPLKVPATRPPYSLEREKKTRKNQSGVHSPKKKGEGDVVKETLAKNL